MNNINKELIVDYKINDNITDKDSEYREQLLNFFNIIEYDSNVIIKNIDDIYDDIKNFDELHKYLKRITRFSHFKDDNHKANMLLLFSYDYFQEFSYCLKDIVNYNKITEINDKKLLDSIN